MVSRALFWPLRGLPLPFAVFALTVTAPAAGEPTHPYPACDKSPTERELSAAMGAFEAGEVSFQESDYERAILYWEDAFRRDCTAVKMLLNLARAYELAGQPAQAILALETYLERVPQAEDRTSIEKRLVTLRRRVREQPARSSEKSAHDQGTRERDASDNRATQSDHPEHAAATQSTASSSDQQDVSAGRTRRRPAWPVITTGVGIAATSSGLGLWIDAANTLNALGCDATGEGNERECPPANVDEANASRNRRNAGIALTVAGGALTATSAVLWAVLWSGPAQPSRKDAARAKRVRVAPLLSPHFAGVHLSGQF